MVLAFDSTGKYGQEVFGNTSSQTAGANGAIVQHNPSATAPAVMAGGKRKRRSQRRNQRQSQRQNGGKNKRRSQRRNQSKRQRGGK